MFEILLRLVTGLRFLNMVIYYRYRVIANIYSFLLVTTCKKLNSIFFFFSHNLVSDLAAMPRTSLWAGIEHPGPPSCRLI